MPRKPLPDVDRIAASQAAVAARRARARIKADIESRARSPLEVAETAWREPESAESRLRLPEFLLAVPAIGSTKAHRVLERLGISPVKRLGGLGPRQRVELERFLLSWERAHPSRASRLVVLAGPTAVGKGTVAAHIRKHHSDVMLSISATTRTRRPGETHGESYFFVDDEEFDRMITQGELLEWAVVHNTHRYGTPRAPVEAAIAAGQKVLLEIDIQGARAVKKSMPDAHLVFLLPPSWDELVRRLVGRGTETPEEQQRRLETARTELAAVNEFESTVINDDVSQAAQKVVDLMTIAGSRRALKTSAKLRGDRGDIHG